MSIGYFQNFKKTFYDLDGTPNQINYNQVTNILTRVTFFKDLLEQSDLYYQYIIKDTDTPENIADRYYGDPNYFWIVLLFNMKLDPQFDWPLNSYSLDRVIRDKYGDALINDIHHYELHVDSYDVMTQTSTNFVYIIDENTYNNTPEFANENIDANGFSLAITTTTLAVTNYDFEISENENKRQINILKKDYLGQVTSELEKALS